MTGLPDYSNPPFANYESPELKPGIFSRLFPSPCFYVRVLRVVLGSAYLAKRGRYGDFEWYMASYNTKRAFEKTGARVSIKGTEHFAKLDQPCVFIGNHMSTAETFLLPSMIRPIREVSYVVKQSLVDYPIFKHVIRARDPIVVGRVNPRDDLKAVLGGGQERLEQGISIIIFPQRTRTVEFDRDAFNTIGVKLAKRAGVPVIPLALKTNAWSNGKLLKDYGTFDPSIDAKFEFGEPIDVVSNGREAHQAVIEFIESRFKKWG